MACEHNWMMGSALVIRPPCPYCAQKARAEKAEKDRDDALVRAADDANEYAARLAAMQRRAERYREALERLCRAMDKCDMGDFTPEAWLAKSAAENALAATGDEEGKGGERR